MNRDVYNDSRFVQTVIEKTNELEKQDQVSRGLGEQVGVVLTQFGADAMAAIRLVKKVTGLSGDEARDLVNSMPYAL